MNDQNTEYIRSQLAAGVLPTQIVQNLVGNGWQQAQATALVQQVSGVQLATTGTPGGYTKPPIILQIVFAFSVIGLLVGIGLLIFAANIYLGNNSSLNGDGFGEAIAALMAVFGVALLFNFWFVKKLRDGKLWALKAQTALVIITTLIGFGLPIIDGGPNATELAGQAVGQNLFAILIVVYLWTRHRAYFK